MKKFKKSLVMVLAVTFVLTMFAGIPFAKAAGEKNVINLATFSDPINLNPALSSDSASSDVLAYVFRGLLERDWKTNLVPDIAAEMPTVSKDNKTITFKLRKDVKWHDGKQFTSADVKFSYEMILNKKFASPRYNEFETISKIDAPDPYTVVFHLKTPDSTLLPKFTYNYIFPKHLWENIDPAKAKESPYNKKPIGNGPYKLTEWKNAERIVLEANSNFYLGAPKVKKIIFTITPSQAVAMVKAETGEADMVALPESDIARMKTKSNLNIFVYDRAVFDCVLYNTKSPLFSDKRVRQALTYAINKPAIVNGIYRGLGKVADGSYHPKIWAYSSNVKKYSYNISMAKRLLDQAGWKVGKDGIRVKNGKKFTFELLTNKGNIMREKLTVVIQSQLRLVGIKVQPRILEWNTFLTKYVDVGKFDAYVGGFSTGLDGDQTTFYYGKDRLKGYLNKGEYYNARVNKLLDDAKLTFDRAQQKKMYEEIQKIVAEEQPMTFLVYRKGGLAVNKRCKGARTTDLLGTNGEEINWTID